MRAIIRNDAPTAKVRNVDAPVIRSGHKIEIKTIQEGMPIGLLLALTYSWSSFRGEAPFARIRNTD